MNAQGLDVFFNEPYGQVLNPGEVGLVGWFVPKLLGAQFDQNRYFEDVRKLGPGIGLGCGDVRHGFARYEEPL